MDRRSALSTLLALLALPVLAAAPTVLAKGAASTRTAARPSDPMSDTPKKLWERCEAAGLGNNLIAVVCTIEEQNLTEAETLDSSWRKSAVRRLHDMELHDLAEEVAKLPPYRGG